ncbi:MAG: hypothetical protein R3258_05105 [Acidimicrobiia bacterium]|nr:hypothetical protein [Acidimicrobiia bacterium]
MRTLTALALAGAVAVGLGGTAATAELPPHPHILLIGADVEIVEGGNPPFIVHSYERCVDIASNQTLRLNAHHEHFHFGTAGDALRRNTGNFPFPTAPFPGVPWEDCASFELLFGS